ncbi:MAG TPA: homoserine dehydrogenase [bacterium]|nr:homoserine dehydrogenase [bacterium]
MKREINIGLIGYGTVGSGVYKVLESKQEYFTKRIGINYRIKYVCDVRKEIKEQIDTNKTKFTENYKDIIKDETIDIVVELIGGIEPAKTIILEAIKNKKNVVTANKALLSLHWLEIYEAAKQNNVNVLFEASVAGAIPILDSLKYNLSANNISAIYGIINGTCNYILTRMSKENIKFKEALKSAQQKGFAEADPTYDIEGFDSQQKLTLLILLGFGSFINREKILCEGISKVSLDDIIFGKELDFEMKLLAIAKLKNNKIEARVHPTFINKKSVLASVSYEDNAVFVEGDLINRMTFHGKGAGSLPTASAVISDIFEIARLTNNNNFYNYIISNYEVLDKDEIESEYYFHFSVVDKPGVLAKITSVLGANNISISQVIQKQSDNNQYVPIIMLTHLAKEKNVNESIKIINKLDCVKKETIIYRVEKF